jgi:O-antigen/teichoic acid export membrane protein
MKKVRAVSRNAAALTTAKLVNSSLTLLLAIAINRKLGPANAGIYILALTVYMMLGIIPDFGLGHISIRDVSQDHSRMSRYLPKVLLIRMAIGGAILALLTVVDLASYRWSSAPDIGVKFWAISAISLSLLVEMPVTNTLAEALSAVEQFSFIAFVYLNISILKIGLSLYVLLGNFSQPLVLLMLAYVVTQAYGALHFYVYYRRKGYNRVEPDKEADVPDRLVAYLLRSAWPLALLGVGLAIYSLIDIPILSLLKGDTEVGLYNAAYMFARSFFFLVTTLNLVALPIVARAYRAAPENIGRLWEQLMRYGAILIIPLSLIVPLLGRPVLILQEHDFISAMPALWLTMGAAVFVFMYTLMYPFFVTINSQRTLTAIITWGIGVKVLLNLALVPFLGYKGTALAMLGSESIMFGILYFSLSRKLDHRIKLLRFAGVPAATALVLYGGIFVFGRDLMVNAGGTPSLAGSLVVGAVSSAVVFAIYLVVVLATKQISRKGLSELDELLEAGTEPVSPAAPEGSAATPPPAN